MVEKEARAKFYEKRKRRRRKIVLRRILLMLITVFLTVSLIGTVVSLIGYFASGNRDNGFVPWPYGSNLSKNVKIATETEIPKWIDVQLIHKHQPPELEDTFRILKISLFIMLEIPILLQ